MRATASLTTTGTALDDPKILPLFAAQMSTGDTCRERTRLPSHRRRRSRSLREASSSSVAGSHLSASRPASSGILKDTTVENYPSTPTSMSISATMISAKKLKGSSLT